MKLKVCGLRNNIDGLIRCAGRRHGRQHDPDALDQHGQPRGAVDVADVPGQVVDVRQGRRAVHADPRQPPHHQPAAARRVAPAAPGEPPLAHARNAHQIGRRPLRPDRIVDGSFSVNEPTNPIRSWKSSNVLGTDSELDVFCFGIDDQMEHAGREDLDPAPVVLPFDAGPAPVGPLDLAGRPDAHGLDPDHDDRRHVRDRPRLLQSRHEGAVPRPAHRLQRLADPAARHRVPRRRHAQSRGLPVHRVDLFFSPKIWFCLAPNGILWVVQLTRMSPSHYVETVYKLVGSLPRPTQTGDPNSFPVAENFGRNAQRRRAIPSEFVLLSTTIIHVRFSLQVRQERHSFWWKL